MNTTPGANASTDRRAFSAVELMLTCVLLAVVMVPFLNTVLSTGREAGHAEAFLLAGARAHALVASVVLGGAPKAGSEETALPVPELLRVPPALPGADPAAYEEQLSWRMLADGLVRVRAVVRWEPPLARRTGRRQEAVAIRMVSRPESSWLQSPPVRRQEVLRE